jgi:hypothetical protein
MASLTLQLYVSRTTFAALQYNQLKHAINPETSIVIIGKLDNLLALD